MSPKIQMLKLYPPASMVRLGGRAFERELRLNEVRRMLPL